MDVIKVSAHSRSTAVAGAIAGIVRDNGHAEVQAIGASAVNQAIKAVAIARTYLTLDGIEIACLPEFVEVDIEGQERTAVRLVIVTREGVSPPSPLEES
jgi:stage V sporulation protein S